jgi:hypothetical protein
LSAAVGVDSLGSVVGPVLGALVVSVGSVVGGSRVVAGAPAGVGGGGVPSTLFGSSGSAASGGVGGGWFGGWAALVLVFGVLLVPAWRRLVVVPVVWRPVPFVCLLERPG